mgnify:CR=1 FL=1
MSGFGATGVRLVHAESGQRDEPPSVGAGGGGSEQQGGINGGGGGQYGDGGWPAGGGGNSYKGGEDTAARAYKELYTTSYEVSAGRKVENSGSTVNLKHSWNRNDKDSTAVNSNVFEKEPQLEKFSVE